VQILLPLGHKIVQNMIEGRDQLHGVMTHRPVNLRAGLTIDVIENEITIGAEDGAHVRGIADQKTETEVEEGATVTMIVTETKKEKEGGRATETDLH